MSCHPSWHLRSRCAPSPSFSRVEEEEQSAQARLNEQLNDASVSSLVGSSGLECCPPHYFVLFVLVLLCSCSHCVLHLPLSTCVFAENRAKANSVRAELIRLMRVPMNESAENAPKATPAEVRALAEMMNQQMATLFAPNERTFYRLFKYMDADGNGMIEFDEFEDMVRRQLDMPTDEMSYARLLSLWRAIDKDGNGRVDQGEFGRFMRFGSAEVCDPDSWMKVEAAAEPSTPQLTPRRTRISLGSNPMADAKARIRSLRAQQRDRDRDDSERDVARRIKARAQSLDLEALRLESLLAEKERARRDAQRA